MFNFLFIYYLYVYKNKIKNIKFVTSFKKKKKKFSNLKVNYSTTSNAYIFYLNGLTTPFAIVTSFFILLLSVIITIAPLLIASFI